MRWIEEIWLRQEEAELRLWIRGDGRWIQEWPSEGTARGRFRTPVELVKPESGQDVSVWIRSIRPLPVWEHSGWPAFSRACDLQLLLLWHRGRKLLGREREGGEVGLRRETSFSFSCFQSHPSCCPASQTPAAACKQFRRKHFLLEAMWWYRN